MRQTTFQYSETEVGSTQRKQEKMMELNIFLNITIYIFETRRGKTRQGKARQGKARQGKARQGKARQGKARQGKARQGKARQG